MREMAAGFERRAWKRNEKVILQRKKLRGRSWEAGLRGGKAREETTEPLTVPADTNGSTRLPIRLPEPGTSIWALSGEQARPGFVCWTLREIS